MKHAFYILSLLFSQYSYGQYLTNYSNLNSFSQNSINLFLNTKGVDTTTTETNPVESFSIEYKTVNANGDTVLASGAIYIPILEHCYSSSMLVYEHGTEFTKTNVPSYGAYSSRGKYFSGIGYITVMPDYIGLGVNTEIQTYHHSKTEASATLDLIRACREFLLTNGAIQDNKQLYLTGYSQGGHVAMATNKYIKDYNSQNEFNVVASAPMSGAYNLSGAQRDLVFEDSTYAVPLFLPNIIIGYQSVYGNLFNNYNDVFDAPYDNIYETRVNAGTTSGLFWYMNTPPNHYDFLQDTFVNNMLNDVNRNYHPMNLALKDNDVHNWIPQNPVRMLYCGSDVVVSPLNSVVALDSMTAMGATNVDAININPAGGHNTCYTPAVAYVTLWFDSLKAPCSIGSFSNTTICDGDSVIYNGITYYNDTLISDTLTTSALEDSIVSLYIHVLPTPVVQITTASSDTICENGTVILNAQGANSYLWTHNITSGASFPPQNDTIYRLTGIDQNGCKGFDSIFFKVVEIPTITITASDSTICDGEQIILTQTNNGGYGNWSTSVQENTPIQLHQNTTFTYTAYNSANCFNNSSLSIVVNPLPVIQTNILDSTVCLGDSVNYNAFGTDSIAWNNGITNNAFFVPTNSSYYQVIGINTHNCKDSLGFNLTINNLPTVVANAQTTELCKGDLNRLYGSGAQTYIWNINYIDSTSIPFLNSGLFIVEGTDINGCSSTDSISITVNELPAAFLDFNDTTICNGDSILCAGNNSSLSYNWSNNISDGDFYTPIQTEYIYATATNSNNCSNTDSINISISNAPTLVANASDNQVCLGDSIYLSVNSNATTILWNNNAINNSYYTPNTSLYLSVEAINNFGCRTYDSIYVEVQELPSPIITESNGVLTTLSYDSYQWFLNNSSIINANNNSFTPISSGSYTVLVDSNYCSNISVPFIYNATAISNYELLDFSIYPNPATNFLKVKNYNSFEKIQLINSRGERIKITILDSTIDLRSLSNGNYILIGFLNGKTITHQFIKQ